MSYYTTLFLMALSAPSFASELIFQCEGSGKYSISGPKTFELNLRDKRQVLLVDREQLKVSVTLNGLGPGSSRFLLGILVSEINKDGFFELRSAHGRSDDFVMYHEVPSDGSKNGLVCSPVSKNPESILRSEASLFGF